MKWQNAKLPGSHRNPDMNVAMTGCSQDISCRQTAVATLIFLKHHMVQRLMSQRFFSSSILSLTKGSNDRTILKAVRPWPSSVWANMALLNVVLVCGFRSEVIVRRLGISSHGCGSFTGIRESLKTCLESKRKGWSVGAQLRLGEHVAFERCTCLWF